MKLPVYLVFLFVILNTVYFAQDLRVISSDKNSILLEYRPEYKDTITIEAGTSKYIKIDLPGTYISNSNKIGDVQKLVRQFNVGVPEGVGNTIQILSEDYSYLIGKYAPVPHISSDSAAAPTYSESNNYNKSKYSDIIAFGEYGQAREIPIQSIIIYPVQFDGASNNIRLLKKILFRINYGQSALLNRRIIQDNSYSSIVLNYEVAKYWGMENNALPKTSNSLLANDSWYKIEINEEGIYKIDRSYLQSMGIDLSSLDVSTIKIFGNGGRQLPEELNNWNNGMIENSIQVFTKATGEFDYLLFYGRGVEYYDYSSLSNEIVRIKHPYSKKNFYWLTYGGAAGKRMKEKASITTTNFYNQSSTLAFRTYEKDSVNIGKTGREYFGDALTSITTSRTFINSLNGLIPSTPISYRIRTINTSPFEIPLRIDETGKQIHKTTIGSDYEYSYGVEDYFSKSFTADLPDERSALKISISSDQPNAKVYLDFIEIQYQKYLRAFGDNLLFFSKDTTANIRYALTNFSSQSVQVFDVTDYSNVESIKGTVDGGIFTFISAQVQRNVKKYLAISPSQYKMPIAAAKINNQNIRGIIDGREMIIITSKEFKNSAEKYLRYRTTESPNKLSAEIFYVDEIMNEFGGGLLDPTAIRDFLKHAFKTWQVKPEYALLFGDASYDYLNTEKKFCNFVPTYQTSESLSKIGSYATDDYFACIVGDDSFPDLAIGRLSCQTAAEADSLVKKIVYYETNSPLGNWRNLITLVSDDEYSGKYGYEGSLHTRPSETIANNLIPKSFDLNKVYLAAYPAVFTGNGRIKPDVNKAIINAINQGTLILNYYGHGAPQFWADEVVFEMSIAKTQLKNNKYFFLTAATCEFGRFDDPSNQSATETLLQMSNAGIIAGLSACRLVSPGPNELLNESLYSKLFLLKDENELPIRLGKAYMLAKQNSNGDVSNSKKFILFGDPSIRLNMPHLQVTIDSINGNSSRQKFELNALSSINLSGILKSSDGKINPLNGEILLSVYDSERLIELKSIKDSITATGGLIFRGRVNVTAGKFKTDFVVPKDISYENKNGKIVAYFYNENTDGVGFINNFTVGGTNQNVKNDGEGPQIEIYFDDENFDGAYLVNPNFQLIAKLKDQTGINTTGYGIGHRLEGILNNDANSTYDFSNYFIGDINSGGKSGIIKYPFIQMPIGDYSIKIKAWDVFNNPSIHEAFFSVVSDEKGLQLREVVNYPNPMSSNTTFTFQHNYKSAINVRIRIYSVAGRMIKEIEEWNLNEKFVRLDWDGRDEEGSQLANGTYLYKINVESTDANFANSVLGKISVIR